MRATRPGRGRDDADHEHFGGALSVGFPANEGDWISPRRKGTGMRVGAAGAGPGVTESTRSLTLRILAARGLRQRVPYAVGFAGTAECGSVRARNGSNEGGGG
ncbi:hypothetical protein GCM10012280_10620 [Wenjunlia tyrosinilytica]|uniref:Uncharacterized protein n=1 Tax=Wenjunlia tyrosinilytica TaxID=1544741 RepID=A0A917ZH42_9ACTN|nr:hypothetical protein GCM10012280_10620 [Wenjunlia tyrosinilytica]